MYATAEPEPSGTLSSIRGSPNGPAKTDGSQGPASVCDADRSQYLTILRQSLSENVNAVRPYGYYADKTVQDVLIPLSKDMEKYAYKMSMKSATYRKIIADTIKSVENSTRRGQPFGPTKVEILSECGECDDVEGGSDPVDSAENPDPPETQDASENRPEPRSDTGRDDEAVWHITDRVRSTYVSRLRQALAENVARAQGFFGGRSLPIVAKCLNRVVSATDENALQKCTVLNVYRERMCKHIRTVRDSTGRGEVFEPFRAVIASANRKWCGDTDRSIPKTDGPPATSSKLEVLKILSSVQTGRRQPVDPRPRTELAAVGSFKTVGRSVGRPKPYDSQKRPPTYGQVVKGQVAGSGRSAAGKGLRDVPRGTVMSVEDKKRLTRNIVANLVVSAMKPLYRAGFLDKKKFEEVAKSITDSFTNRNSGETDEKIVCSYVLSYFSDENNFKTN